MAKETSIGRRDFLKISGMSAAAVATMPVFGHVSDDEAEAATEDYSSFYVQTHSEENPPYDVDNNVYKRFSSMKFHRLMSPVKMIQRSKNMIKNMAEKTPGSDRISYAFSSGASRFMFHNSDH